MLSSHEPNRWRNATRAWGISLGFCLLAAAVPAQMRATQTPVPQTAEDIQDEKKIEPAKKPVEPPLQIFDESAAAKVNPIRDAAERLLKEQVANFHPPLAESSPIATYDFSLIGKDEKAIVRDARILALQAASARLYFDEYFIIGLDLLKNYLEANGQQFVVRTEVLQRQILTDNRLSMRLRMAVDLDALYKDLYRKRFIAEPNLRPLIAVHLRELVDGKPDPAAEGRRRVESTMQGQLFRSQTKEMREPPLDADLTQSEGLLQTGRLEAQRHNVDILLTGTLSIHGTGKSELLFDNYDFQDAQLTLSMYRVDNGELLQKVEDRYSAAGGDTPAAIGSVLDSMVARSSKQLADTLRAQWDVTMLDKADFRLLIDNIDESDITAVENSLRTLDPDMKLYHKAYYGRVLVLNVVAPGVDSARMEDFLRTSTQPQFKVEKLDKRHFELRLL